MSDGHGIPNAVIAHGASVVGVERLMNVSPAGKRSSADAALSTP